MQVPVGGAIADQGDVLRKMVLHAELMLLLSSTVMAESMGVSLGSCPSKSLLFWSVVIVGGSCDSLLHMLMVLFRP